MLPDLILPGLGSLFCIVIAIRLPKIGHAADACGSLRDLPTIFFGPGARNRPVALVSRKDFRVQANSLNVDVLAAGFDVVGDYCDLRFRTGDENYSIGVNTLLF